MEEYVKSLNEVLNRLSISLRSNIYSVIDKIANIDVSVFDKEPLKSICNTNLLYIVLTLIWAIIIAIAVKYVLNLYSDIAISKIYFYILKCVVIGIISINSYSICKEIIKINNLLTQIVASSLEETIGSTIEYKFLDDNIDSIDELISSKDKLSLNGVKDGIVCFYMISLLVLLSLRYVIVISCIIISPVMCILLLVPNLNNYFYTYIKVFIYNLLLQNINILILYIPISARTEKSVFLPIIIGSIVLIYNVNKKAGSIIYEKKN